MVRVFTALSVLAIASTCLAKERPLTSKHEKGRCALRGQCGKKSLFGSDLPCPDNEPAEEPEAKVRKELVELCGDKWREGPVCCREDQVGRHHACFLS